MMEFPKTIIQLLQSCYLTTKEAAQTAVLSKSWNAAWLTRPHLVLDESDFEASKARDFYGMGEFPNYAKKTLKRYEQSNLKIESFELCMDVPHFGVAALANKLILKALTKLGPTRLSFQQRDCNNYRNFAFSHEVLFGAENNLVELSLKGCHITVDGLFETKRSRLQFLSLDNVYITRDALSILLSSCPLIENLSLSKIEMDEQWRPSHLVGPKRPMKTNLDRLRCLVLCSKTFKFLFPGDLLSKFPLLVDLTLLLNVYHSGKQEDVQISNRSLERLKIEATGGWARMPRIKLDVPSIRKFTLEFGGGDDIIPSLHVVSCSATREWESCVSITVGVGLTDLWYKELNDLLTQLRQSKIHLSLRVACSGGIVYKAGGVSFVRQHELENLEIDMAGVPCFNCYALFDGLFRLCRPKTITQTQKKEENPNHQYFPPQYPRHLQRQEQRNIHFVLLCQALDQGIHSKVSDPRMLLFGSLIDLEEANAQIFDDGVGRWGPPISLKSLLLLLEDEEEDLQQLEDEEEDFQQLEDEEEDFQQQEEDLQQQPVRLLLKWKP